MATPVTAGSALLVRQYFTDGFYPSGGCRCRHHGALPLSLHCLCSRGALLEPLLRRRLRCP